MPRPRRSIKLAGCALLCAVAAWGQPAPAQPNASLTYRAVVSADPAADVSVSLALAGANEIRAIRLDKPPQMRITHSSGSRDTSVGTVQWVPQGLTGALRYTIGLPHERDPGAFDSYHGGDWLVTRARDLFPAKSYTLTAPLHLLTRVEFALPTDWTIQTAMLPHPTTPAAFTAPQRNSPITSPYGWMMAGVLDTTIQQIQHTRVTITSPRRAGVDHAPLWALLRAILPPLHRLTQHVPDRLLIGLAPAPFWRGGLSGEDSLMLHADLPLIARDHTSTAVHELFHISQHAKKSSEHDDWIVEGLAEYYSLKLLRSGRLLTAAQWRRGIEQFAAQSTWRTNFATSTAKHVLYNAAPLVFFAMDHEIAAATGKTRNLDDVVTRLLADDKLSAETLQGHLTYIAPNINWAQWLSRYTKKAEMPAYEQWLE